MDYMNLGVRSRKTGLTVDKPVRKDEHSMENLDDFFKESSSGQGQPGPQGQPQGSTHDARPGPGPGLGNGNGNGNIPGPSQVSLDGFKIPSTVPEPGTSPANRTPGTPENQTSDQWFADVHDNIPGDIPGSPPDSISPGTPRTKRFIRENYQDEEEEEEDHDFPDDSVRLTPRDDYRDVPDLVDDGDTTRDESFVSENVLLEDELDDDFRPESDLDDDYRDQDPEDPEDPDSSDGSSDDSSDDSDANSDPDDDDDDTQDEALIQSQAKDLLQNDMPMQATGVRRSTRVKVAPLEFWRNEKIVYKRKSNKPVLEIDKIITYNHDQDEEEEQFLKNKRSKANLPKTKSRPYNYIPSGRPRGRPRKNKQQQEDPQQDIATTGKEASPNAPILEEIKNGTFPNAQWLQQGIFQTTVNVTADEKKDEDILAFGPGLAQAEQVTSSDKDKFTLSILFDKHKERFASGILKLPVDGEKTLANAHNAFINFYVIHGIVEVVVENKKFVCTTGSSFQVPAFNTYGFTNKGKDNADLYFVQVTVPETFDASQEPYENSDKSSSNMSLTTT